MTPGKATPSAPDAVDWTAALEAEYSALSGARPPDLPAQDDAAASAERLAALHRQLHQRRLTALCLSGGGIRSATFGLGVLQALARIGVLGRLDYLSTVSGGGYVGGWLTSWIHRAGRADALSQLDRGGERDVGTDDFKSLSPVDRLRATCRYLAPAGGLLSADVWTLLATMGRNLLLNWLVLLPLVGAALLVPRLYMATIEVVEQNVLAPPNTPCLAVGAAPFWLALVSLTMFIVAIGYVVMNFVGRGEGWSQRRFLSFVVAPTVAGTIGLTLFWSAYPCAPDETAALFVSAVLPAAGWLVIGALARPTLATLLLALGGAAAAIGALISAGGWTPAEPPHLAIVAGVPLMLITIAAINRRLSGRGSPAGSGAVRMNAGARTVTAAFVAGPIVGFGAYWFARQYFYFGDPLGETYAVFAVPGILALMLLANTTFLGLSSDELTDAALEWWNRFAAWLAIAAAVWLAAGVFVFYLADLVELAVQAAARLLRLDHHAASTLVSVLIPLVSSLAGVAARSTPAGPPSRLRRLVQSLTLPIAIVVLLATVAWFNAWALRGFAAPGEVAPRQDIERVVWFGAFLLGFGLLMSRFVPVNRFSLHGMYRQRLVRTFLGASHVDRKPNAFTGFDPTDDLRVHELSDVRPLHVINATLNDLSSTGYGRNDKKAYAFTFSPLHVGSPVLGYRRSSQYGSDGGGPATGLSLGMALAVSGAAASSAMGMYSSKARAFLLTLANARLGLWFGNPTDAKTWQRSDPALGVGPIVRELLGLETKTNPYVYLSDGGHFENLGLWSMVARRCAVIIVSDAGCDPDYTFDDLANAVRRIRIDFGIPIELNTADMTKVGQGAGNAHVALGKIHYSAVDGSGTPYGHLIYIKATMSGDETVDVRNFAATHAEFPHDSTADQFYAEDRFESYRALGYHSVLSVAGHLQDADAWALWAAISQGAAATDSAPPAARSEGVR
jgi:hypothetical protein